jgi:uncharacterized membrane protein YbhN (UPF0104 family)
MRRKLGRIAAWIVTIGVLGYLFWGIPVNDVLRAAHSAAPWTIPVVALLVVLVALADCVAMWKTFAWFVAPLSFREIAIVRGASYLLALINYGVGQGAIVYFANRSRGVPVLRGTAAVLLIMGTNLLLLLFLATIGMMFGAEALPEVRMLVIAGYAGLAVYVLLLLVRPRWLTRQPIFDVLLGAGLRGHLKAMAVRLPHVLLLHVLHYASLHAFGIQVPVPQVVLYGPVVFLVAVLPISVQGLGPAQGAMKFFYARYATGDAAFREATVLTAGLSSQAISWCVQVVIGLLCIRSTIARTLEELPKEMRPAS